MRLRVSTVAVALAVMLGTATSAAAYTNLQPGSRDAGLAETVPVNVVFVGFEPADVPATAFRAGLPARYEPVVRSRLWYGMKETLGLRYTFDYNLVYAGAAWENAFFGFLAGEAAPADRTLFQNLYNAEVKNVLDVGQNHFIDAPTVERWLADNPPPGVDTRRNTVFFVNWWGRPDFKFHVYTKIGEPDPDTGYDFGVRRASRKIVAWGGTAPADEETGYAGDASRIWFYDLSAGPESWGGSYNVDDHDLDGDGQPDYRIPVIWEYGDTKRHYRSSSLLASDLAKVTRFGAINLLFTPSPLYPPYINPPLQPSAIQLDLNTYEGWSGVDASAEYQTPELLRDEIAEVHRVPYSYDEQEQPLTGQALECYRLFVKGGKCYPDRPQYPSFANLFLYTALNLVTWQDDTAGRYDGSLYEAGFFNYASDRYPAPYLGFADDNWQDGTQSGTFNFVSPAVVQLGYGLTTTQIHEYGHHFGMSHPHDGYDSELGVDYGPTGPFFFAWQTDEVNSMMSYIDLNWDYSQFDLDNANRFQAAAYILNANEIAARVGGRPAAAPFLAQADARIGEARAAMAAHDYVTTFDRARQAYESALAGAAAAGVTIEPAVNGWVVSPPRRDWKGPVARKDYAYMDKIGPGTKRNEP